MKKQKRQGKTMRKQLTTITAITLLTSSTLFGLTPIDATHASRDISENINTSNAERFQYNKGFKDGYEVGKREGYALALKDAKKALKMYKNIIAGYESGKFLSKKGKITPPRIYQKRGKGGVEVIVEGCELRGSLSPSDILLLPKMMSEYEIGGGRSSSLNSSSSSRNNEYSNSVFLSGVDNPNTMVAKPTSSEKNINTIVLRDTSFYRDLLRKSGVLYTVEGNGGGLTATFSSRAERESFVKSYNLTRGRDYQ